MMSQQTGMWLPERAHIHQSINDIISTRIGSRIQREDYGSIVADVIDQPFNDDIRMLLSVGILMALATWENRIVVHSVRIVPIQGNIASATLIIEYEINGRADTFESELAK